MLVRCCLPAGLLALSLLAACANASEIAGAVSSANQPIPGATVTAVLGDKKVITITDESGRYVLKDLSPGTWSIRIEMFGFSELQRNVTVAG